MKSTLTMRLAVLAQCAVIAANAYPGGQQPRNTNLPVATTPPSLDEVMSSTGRSDSSSSSSRINSGSSLSSPTPAAFPEVERTSSAASQPYTIPISASYAAYSRTSDGQLQREEATRHSATAGTYYEDVGDAVDQDEGSDDDCDEYDDCDDQDYEDQGEILPREVENESIASMLGDFKARLRQIESLLALQSAHVDVEPLQKQEQPKKREASNVFDQGREYGQQSRHLTQEQKNSLMALVRGINGYQTSVDGIENAGQTEAEISRETSGLTQSEPFLSSLLPSQVDDLASLLGLLLNGKQASNSPPSTASTASQVGQSASQAGWMVPGDGTLRDAGYTVQSSADMSKYTLPKTSAAAFQENVALRDKLQDLKEQQEQIMAQLAGYTASTQADGDSHRRLQAKMQESLHPLSDAEYDELSSMLLDGEASSDMGATPTTVSSLLTSPTQSTSLSSSPSPTSPSPPLQARDVFSSPSAHSALKEPDVLSTLIMATLSRIITGPLLLPQDLLDLRELISSSLDQAK